MQLKKEGIIAIFLVFLIVFLPISFVDAFSITNVSSSAEKDSAIVKWSTDDVSSGLVNYGLTKSLGQSSSHIGLLNAHEVNLLGLIDGRQYYFELKSVNSSGAEKIDNNHGNYYTFNTKDSTPPARVTGVDEAGKGLNYITIKWDAVVVTDFLKYIVYRDNVNIANTSLAKYADSGLYPDTPYQYKVAAVDTSGNIGMESLIKEIRTLVPDYKQPEIDNISIGSLNSNGGTVKWSTDEASSSIVFYGLNANVENKVEKNDSVAEHSVELQGLLNDTVYYYKLVSCDASNNCAESSMQNFRTGEDTEPPTIEAEIPDWYNANRLDISGKTEAFARVRVYVNDNLIRALNTDMTGNFRFAGVSLDTSLPSNKIKIVAVDQVGFESFIEKNINLDIQPPVINVTQLGKYSHEQNLIMEGFVNEEVILSISAVSGEKKLELLPKITGLKLLKQEGNSVELEWNEVNGSILGGYIIYRNGKKMTSFNDNHFIDPVLNKSKQYTYEISAYDQKCIEGGKSDPLTVSVSSNASEIDDKFEELKEFCYSNKKDSRSMTVTGKFSQSLELQPGKNLVVVNATDKAGNSVIIEQDTILDTDKPEILEDNLDQLSPSYIQDATVKGKVSKKEGQSIIVTVIVNDDESYSEPANEDGTFSVNIRLEREVYDKMDEEIDYDPERRDSNYYAEFGQKWENNIKIIARTDSGLESEPREGAIDLATCGYGSWWSIELGQPSPDILTPRLILEGMAQIGLPVMNIKWQGGNVVNGSLNYIDVKTPPISDIDQERYDLDWVQSVQYMYSDDYHKGYVQILLKKLDSGSLFMDSDEAKEGKSEDKLTTLEMENYLSEHRLKDNDCIVPGFGCIRIPLMMEIDFSYVNSNKSSTYTSYERREIEETKQKQCWDVEVSIDRRLPSDKIPEEFLKQSIILLNQTITAINDILKPLNTVKEVLFYGCAGSVIFDYAMAFQESFNCEFSETLNVFTEDSDGKKTDKWNVYDAQTGQCETKDFSDDQKNACKQCEDAIRARETFEKNMRMVCDRIFCPSAPTLQKYVKDMSDQYRGGNFWEPKIGKEALKSDCAYDLKQVSEDKQATYKSQKTLSYYDVKDIYDTYVEKKESEEDEDKCSDLHVPTNNCCGTEYMDQWDSACLLMNELKESKCLALDNSKVPINDDEDCGGIRNLWNSLAGFCEPDGKSPPEIVPANDIFRNKDIKQRITGITEDDSKNYVFVAGNGQNSVWFRFLTDRDTVGNVLGSDAEANVYYAEIGYISSDIQNADEKWEKGKVSRVSSTTVFNPLTGDTYGGQYIDLFPIDVTTTNYDAENFNNNVFDEFKGQYTAVTETKDIAKIKQVYNELQERIGTVDKEYIVDPTSGMLRSFQCVCLPGITSYLNLWKKVMEAIKVCFETVLMTGDGSSGICKAVLSIYVCDLIYDLISCFTKKYGAGHKREYSGGIGNFFGALTSAGNKVSNGVANRYGESSIFKALFAERKLAHAACLWAFTGTWDFDVNAVLEEDVSIDVQSVAFLYPCTRRYISFSPASNPSGLTTYNYHLALGMVAGSKLGYSVDMICSDDYSCDTPDGKCDCVGIGKQTRHVTMGPGTASRGGVIEEEFYENVMDAPFRYDKAIVTWNSADSGKNGQTECKIKNTGGNPPAFCQLDAAEGKYRCTLGAEQAESYIRFYNEPTLTQSVYTLNDFINVKLRLSQRQPQSVQQNTGKEFNQYTKFMQMKLYRGDTLLKETQTYNLNGNGMHDFDNLPNIRIEERFFSAGKAQLIVEPSNVIRSRGFQSGKSGPSSVDYYDIYIDFTSDTNYAAYREVADGTSIRKINLAQGQLMPGNFVYIDNYYLELNSPPKAGQKLHVRYVPYQQTGESCPSTLEKWRLHIAFYDSSDNIGTPSAQPSTYMGQPVEANVEIPVMCKKPTDQMIPACVYGGKTMERCRCGTVECAPNDYCNYQDGKVSCDKVLKENVAAQNKAPEIKDVKFTVNGLTQPVIQGTTYDVSGRLILSFNAVDDGTISSVLVKVGTADATANLVSGSTYATSEFELPLGSADVTIVAKDNIGAESSQFKFTLNKK